MSSSIPLIASNIRPVNSSALLVAIIHDVGRSSATTRTRRAVSSAFSFSQSPVVSRERRQLARPAGCRRAVHLPAVETVRGGTAWRRSRSEADDLGPSRQRPVRQAGLRLVAADDVYLCPAGERLTYHYTNEEEGKTLRRYWTTACQGCALKGQCTTGKERRISRWEHEAVLEAVQARLDRNPDKMRMRRQTVEHPFGTIKSWMGSTHFQMKTLKHVSTEMALHVLAYNMKRVMSILGVGGLMQAIRT